MVSLRFLHLKPHRKSDIVKSNIGNQSPALPLNPQNGDPSRKIVDDSLLFARLGSVDVRCLRGPDADLVDAHDLLYITFPSTSRRRLTLRSEETFSILCNNSPGNLACLKPSS